MRNKTILCIVDQYYPESSANTQCANIIMQKFINEGFSVDFMSIKYDHNLPTVSQNNNSTIYKFENYKIKDLRECGKLFNAKEWREMPWIFRKVKGLFNKLKSLTRLKTEWLYLDTVNYKDIFNMIKSQNKKYAYVVSFSTPFALHVIARQIKLHGLATEWFPVFLDPFVYNYCLNPKRINSRKRTANSVLNDSDGIFMVRGIMEENIKKGYNPKYHNKVDIIELPNLVELAQKTKNLSPRNKETTLTYAGGFYRDIRNPGKMLDILSKLPNYLKIRIIGYSCEDIIEEKAKLFDGNFEFLGKLEYSKTIEYLNNSNILINLGNTITNQTPSKVFEYIALGKPILNFYFSEDDTSLFYFKKYPLALNINLNDYNSNPTESIVEFCNNNKDKKLSFKEATEYLSESRSEVVVEKIYRIITEEL